MSGMRSGSIELGVTNPPLQLFLASSSLRSEDDCRSAAWIGERRKSSITRIVNVETTFINPPGIGRKPRTSSIIGRNFHSDSRFFDGLPVIYIYCEIAD